MARNTEYTNAGHNAVVETKHTENLIQRRNTTATDNVS